MLTTPIKREIADQVLAKINEYQSLGELVLPKDYNPANALKAAHLIINDIDNIGSASPQSIYKSLMKMTIEGLNPMQHQCAFMLKGGNLICQRQYQGSIALAKRKRTDMLQPKAHTVFKDDIFEYETDIVSGRIQILKHKSSLENRKMTEIGGAFCIIPFSDGTYDCCIMSIEEIKTAWSMGSAKGNSSAHRNFPDQQCEKTVINRALKLYIDGSNDTDEVEIIPKKSEVVAPTETMNANEMFEEAEVIAETIVTVEEVKSEYTQEF